MPPDVDERTELDALRLENDTLRRNLGRLEEKVQRAEENALQEQEQAQPQQQADAPPNHDQPQQQMQQKDDETQIPSALQGGGAPVEVHHLHGILQWLHVRDARYTVVPSYRIDKGMSRQRCPRVFSALHLEGSSSQKSLWGMSYV